LKFFSDVLEKKKNKKPNIKRKKQKINSIKNLEFDTFRKSGTISDTV